MHNLTQHLEVPASSVNRSAIRQIFNAPRREVRPTFSAHTILTNLYVFPSWRFASPLNVNKVGIFLKLFRYSKLRFTSLENWLRSYVGNVGVYAAIIFAYII